MARYLRADDEEASLNDGDSFGSNQAFCHVRKWDIYFEDNTGEDNPIDFVLSG